MLSGMSSEEARLLASDLRERRRQIDRLELTWAVDAQRLAESGYHELMGSRRPVDLLRHHCDMAEGAVHDRLAVGRQIDQLAASAHAVWEAEIGFGHLVVMAHVAQKLAARPGRLGFDEAPLLEKAREESVGRFWNTCQDFLHACSPELVAAEAEDIHQMRELTLRRRRDGLTTMWGLLSPDTAASVRAAIAPHARRRGADDSRPFRQRLHDALGEWAGGGRPAQVMVTIAAESLLGLPGTPAGHIAGLPPIASPTIERMTCDCNLRRIVLDPKSTVIDVGRSQRVVTPAVRQALEVRDRGCVWPGCDTPARWSDTHHLIHWARGGTTDLTNQVLLCYFHHRRVHEGGWRIFREANGRITVLRPPVSFGHWARGPDATAAA
jgi:hypothetical protein